jgi:hypothetical protein
VDFVVRAMLSICLNAHLLENYASTSHRLHVPTILDIHAPDTAHLNDIEAVY